MKHIFLVLLGSFGFFLCLTGQSKGDVTSTGSDQTDLKRVLAPLSAQKDSLYRVMLPKWEKLKNTEKFNDADSLEREISKFQEQLDDDSSYKKCFRKFSSF